MMTNGKWTAFRAKWGMDKTGFDRSELSENEHRKFVADYYDAVESFEMRPCFVSGSVTRLNGKRFEIVGRHIENDSDPLCIPYFRIRFLDGMAKGVEMDAEADEIFKM